MIHTISFNLPDDAEDLKMAQRGPRYYSVIQALLVELRSQAKYGDNKSATAEEQRQRIFEILKDHEVLEDF